MIRITDLTLPISYAETDLQAAAARALHLAPSALLSCRLSKRAVDARHKKRIQFVCSVDVTVKGDECALCRRVSSPHVAVVEEQPYTVPTVSSVGDQRPVVVGCGPAGLFAALVLARAGCRPILLERGRAVEQRREDVRRFRQTGQLDPQSNVQFGEGGAGTFSDGKLNTGISDPRCRFVREVLAEAADAEDILWQAKPHVGTDRLFALLPRLRAELIRLGADVRFESQVTDITVEAGALVGLTVTTPQQTTFLPCRHAILAIGHSARDTVAMLHRRGLPMTPKPFAVGVRIEHPRTMIDRSQYGSAAGHPALGAAPYKLNCRPAGLRGVYTFCMCPGGEVMAAASEQGGVAVNGMSEYARQAPNSNAALLVGIQPEDLPSNDPLAGFAFQRKLEQAAFRLGGGDYRAPVQLVGDFLRRQPSTVLGEVEPSYRPGFTLCDLSACLPPVVAASLRAGLPLLGQRLRGFDRADAVLTGVESRSSSPVRLLRGDAGQAAIAGLYPCGEGAGYAGGIVSAAVDGIHCAEWVLQALQHS